MLHALSAAGTSSPVTRLVDGLAARRVPRSVCLPAPFQHRRKLRAHASSPVVACSAFEPGRSHESPSGSSSSTDHDCSSTAQPFYEDVIYGSSFIIQRPRPSDLAGSIVPASANEPSLKPHQQPPCLGLQLHAALGGSSSMVPYDITRFSVLVDGTGVVELPVDSYDVEVLSDVEEGEDAVTEGRAFPPTNCTGIVRVHPDAEDDAQDPGDCEAGGASPRRTGRIQFTCNVCGTTNTKPINPHAWAEGTVFARCCGCNIVHKLRDNLNLIDEIVYSRDDAAPEHLTPAESPFAYPLVVTDLVVPEGLVPRPDSPLDN